MAWVAEAQYLYDVGKQPITSAQVSALRMRQNVLRTLDVTATNALVIALDTADAQNTSVILQNEETRQKVVLSGFAAGSREVALPPLLLAELKAGTLGAANLYSCTVLETASNGVATVKSQAGFVMPSHENKLPVFNYGPAEAVKSTAISERSLVGVGKAKPHFLLASYDDPDLVAKAARMEEEGAYYVYTYQLPDGSLSTYDEVPQSASPPATTTGSLAFEVSASGSTTAQDTANTFTTALWGSVLSGPVPVTVSITFSDLGAGNENVIGQSWEPAVYRSGSIYYPSALRNQKAGYDINKQMSDIRLEFNTRYTFYYGTNGVCPSGQIDYVSVLLHEICHGLGFYATIAPDTGVYENGPSSPFIFDTLLFYRGARVTTLSSTVRAASLTSDALYWDGTNAVKANSGNRIKIYAPTTYQSGSSGSHWDDGITFSTFMKHAYQGVVHTFSSRKLGAMKDLGWTLASETVTPAAPASVAASDDLADKVRVTWSVCTNATFYKIYRYTSNTSGSASQIGTSTTTSYDDLTATADVPYYYWVKAANGTGTSDFGKSDTGLRMSPATAMTTALDTTNLDWTTGGDANWYLQSTVTHDGVDAARSGLIADGQTSWLKTTVTGPGTIGFWTRVSSQLPMFGSDLLSFKIDGIASDIVLGGEVDWTYYTMPVFAGDHELAWEYSKDSSGKAGSDCAWVDEVTFVPFTMDQETINIPATGAESRFVVSTGQTNELSIRSLEDCPAWLSDLVISDENTNAVDFGRGATNLTIHGVTNELRITAYPNTTAFARTWMVEVIWPGGGKQLTYSQDPGPVTATVTFDAAGGVVNPEFITATYGLAYGALPVPVRTPYVFGGWWVGMGGTGLQVTESTTVTNAADHTLYAQWLLPLSVALNTTNLTWTSSGSSNWFAQMVITHDGVAAAQSGAISDDQESALETTVSGPGTLSFWWKVSCEDGPTNDLDWLQFSVDDVEQARIDGEVDWQEATYSLGAGTHQLRWLYHKNQTGSAGMDAGWVDEVRFTPAEAFGFAIQDGLLTATNDLFSMRAIATNNAIVIWDTSTNLVQWVPWWTNTLTNGSFDMQAPIGTNAQQFFRLRLP